MLFSFIKFLIDFFIISFSISFEFKTFSSEEITFDSTLIEVTFGLCLTGLDSEDLVDLVDSVDSIDSTLVEITLDFSSLDFSSLVILFSVLIRSIILYLDPISIKNFAKFIFCNLGLISLES